MKVVGVRLRKAGKIYYYTNKKNYLMERGGHVVVETARGVELGEVVIPNKEVEDNDAAELKNIIKVAGKQDLKHYEENIELGKEAFVICKEKINECGLHMKLLSAEYTFDNKKVLFYFTAEGRIDFRDLVKALASVFKTRIELRQVGVKDETKMLGSIGLCGRELCCSTYLSDMNGVNLKMAQAQNLSLTSFKLSGICGRLMCCIRNEAETYEYLNSKLPDVGEIVTIPTGEKGEVVGTNTLKQNVSVKVDVGDEKEIQVYNITELKYKSKPKKEKKVNYSDADLKELASLEGKDGESRLDD